MSKRKIEAPRSEMFYQSAGYDPFFPVIDEEALRLARLFAEEERLAAKIGNDELTIDNGMVYRAVALARKIAKEGYPIQMVSLDEMLDIAQIFCFNSPHAARSILVDLLAKLQDGGSPAWTARVAVALAYFSALQESDI